MRAFEPDKRTDRWTFKQMSIYSLGHTAELLTKKNAYYMWFSDPKPSFDVKMTLTTCGGSVRTVNKTALS